MVAGYAIGGGHVLHIVCDLTIAADNARFGQTGPRVGSFDGGFGSGLLARIVGQKKAREIWYLCEQYDAQAALDMGLVNKVVPLADLEVETVAWARKMLRALAARAAHAEGVDERGRRRPRRHPATRGRRDAALLHDRGGAGGQERVPREAPARVRADSRSARDATPDDDTPMTTQVAVVPGRAAEDAGRRDRRRCSSVPRRARSTAPINWPRAAAAAVVALALQVGVNFANDYSDGVRGTDAERRGPVRLTATGLATPRAVRNAALISFAVAAVVGAVLSLVVNPWLLLVGVAAIAAAVTYTGGPKPYGYIGLGEVMVLVFFGFVATVGQRVRAARDACPASRGSPRSRSGSRRAAILLANNVRDVDTDRVDGQAHARGSARRGAVRAGSTSACIVGRDGRGRRVRRVRARRRCSRCSRCRSRSRRCARC